MQLALYILLYIIVHLYCLCVLVEKNDMTLQSHMIIHEGYDTVKMLYSYLQV